MSLSGKVVLITGSSRGIGKATALRLASEGASVVINYVSNEASANSLVEQIGSDRALAVQADASNMSDLDRLVDSAVAKFGKIDVLIPNAGILPMKDLENTTEADFDKTYNLMVKGPYFLAQVSTRILSSLKTAEENDHRAESRKAHPIWRPNYLRLHWSHCCLQYCTHISPLCLR
jgi:3-oxoacyl-[acyl-carrier protein] reductase